MARLPNKCLVALLLTIAAALANAFTSAPLATSVRSRALGKATDAPTSLSMVFGPKQALQIEKSKNPQKFEATIQGLMTTKKLTRDQAEKRYGEFLLDPDGFALRAAEAERKEKGYKDWKEQAIAKSSDPEATRKRIDDFQRKNSFKGTAIIVLFFGAVLVYNSMNPYVPPVN